MDLRTRIIITSDDQSRAGFNSAREGLANLERQITQARNALLGLFGVSVGSGLVKSLIETADQYKSIASSIKQAAGENANYEAVQRRVLGIANNSNTALSDTARLYARSSEALKNTGVNQETVLKFTEAVSLSFKANSSDAAAVSSTVTQLTQAIATNAVQWADFGQLADTNLRLVNIAAKNLGYDGMGELKDAISSGKVANVELVDAIVAGFDEIQRAADTAAPTVSGAIQRMSNNFIVYVGAVDQAHGSTASLVTILNFLADHIRTLGALAISLAKYLALIYTAKAVSSVKAYVAAQYQAVLASRAAAEAAAHEQIVQLEVLRVNAAATAARLRATQAALREAYANRRLAYTMEEQIAAREALTRAVANEMEARKAAVAASLAYRNAMAVSETATTRFTLAVQRLNLALTRMPGLIIKAFTGWILIDLLRESNDEFNRWYTVLESIIMKGITILSHFFSAAFLDGKTGNLKQKLDELDEHYAKIFAGIGRHEAEAAAAAEAAAEKERQAREKALATLKAKLDLTEEVYARETAALEQSLAQKQALIDASEQSQAEKDQAKFQLELAADQARVALASAGANARLQLIADAYNREIEANRAKGKADVELDIQYAGARKEVLGQLESAYRESIDHLLEMEAEHRDKALGYGVEIANAEERRAQHLFELEQIGLSDKEALEAQKNRLASEMVKVRELIGQGEFEKAKELSEKTEELAFKIARAEKESYTEGKSLRFDANQAQATYNATVDNTKKALEGLKGQEEGRAKEAKRLADEQSSALNDVQIKINNINTTIGNLSDLKIKTDTSEIDAALAKINSIPTEKTVVIRTVNADASSSGHGASGSWDEAAQTANQNGGLIPAFAGGGFAPKSGKLPGYGGGDRIRALLEAGEFIIRKEAVQKLGVPVLQAINQGQLPIQRASGGPVGADITDKQKQVIQSLLANLRRLALKPNTGGNAEYDPAAAMKRIEPVLRENGLLRFKPRLEQLLPNLFIQARGNISAGIIGLSEREKKINRDKEAKADFLTAHLFDSFAPQEGSGARPANRDSLSARLRVPMPSLSIPMPQLPKLSIPAPSFPSFNGPAVSAAAGTGSETVTLRFVAPGGSSVAGQFGKNDTETMLRILKEAGAVTQ